MKTNQALGIGVDQGTRRRTVVDFVRRVWRCCFFSLGFLVISDLPAQTFTTLHAFNGTDGDEPDSPLCFSGGQLYGATRYGGSAGFGAVFKMNPDGSGFSTLYNFANADADGEAGGPYGALAVGGGAVYGTASGMVSGTIFKINADGSGQEPLHIFSGMLDGDQPFGGVILCSNTLFGTTSSGIVFGATTDGTAFAVLHCLSCDPTVGADCTIYGGLVLVGNYLYGTTFGGGVSDNGLIFKVSTNGGDFAIVHKFQGSDGAGPWAGLLLHSNRLYGTTTRGGGTNTVGVVFAINPDGTGFTNLHGFTGYDGGFPQGGLVGAGGTLYGTTTQGGGIGGAGTVFSLNTDGTGFKTLYTFTNGVDGGTPSVGLTLVGNDLYGTTTTGANQNYGTVFRLSLPVPSATAFLPSSSNLVVSLPTNNTGFVLQFSTNLTTWTTVSTAPLMVNGAFVVTNSVADACRFFRLSR